MVLAAGAGVAVAQPAPDAGVKRENAATPMSFTGNGRTNAPLGEPILSVPAEFAGKRATWWTDRGAKYLLLEGDVTMVAGTYGFRGDKALVRIDAEQLPGRVVRHFMVYLENARGLKGRGPVTADAPRLLVTLATTGDVQLETDSLNSTAPTNDAFVTAAESRFERFVSAVMSPTLPVPPGAPAMTAEAAALRRQRREEIRNDLRRRLDESLAQRAPKNLPPQQGVDGVAAGGAPVPPGSTIPPEQAGYVASGKVLPVTGTVNFSAERIVIQGEGDETALVLMGKVRVAYQSFRDKPGATLTADRAVIFLKGDAMREPAVRSAAADQIRGVYLEDNVIATYDQYTVRAPRVFYDMSLNKAIVLDAVMYTWDVKKNVPVYVRAEKLRQESASSWIGEDALVTTSEFAEPHFAIAAQTVTVQNDPQEGGRPLTTFAAEDMTMRVGSTPVFYWPYATGNTDEIPLRRVDIGYSEQDGPIVKTKWDTLSLLGIEKPPGVDSNFNLDVLGKHGVGIGADLNYSDPNKMFGNLRGYVLPNDDARDEFSDRNTLDFDGEVRGYFTLQHRQYLPHNWELSLETSYVSDPLFLDKYFNDQATTAKPYETSVYAKKQEHDWALTFLAKYDIQDFTPQLTALQSPGYTVDALPEAGYYRVGTSLLGDRLTYYTENRAGRVRIRPGTDTPADRGFTDAQSRLLFGTDADQAYDQLIESAGVPSRFVSRADSRHELQMPLKAGAVDFVPYIAGRVTGYDTDFSDYSSDADNARFMGTLGLRTHTQFNQVYDGVESSLLDVHRLRHIIEPNADFFLTGTTVSSDNYPIYDPDIEGVSDGAGFRAGVRNTLETQRGGPGRWNSVEWLVINTDFVRRSNDARKNNALARFFDYRPEYSIGEDSFHTDVLWRVTDALAAVGDLDYSTESGEIAQWRVGATMRHSADFITFVEYNELAVLNSRLFSYGFTYQLTPKYIVDFRHTWDIRESQSRSVRVSLTRKLPRWRLVIVLDHDEINDNNTFGVVLIPDGVRASAFTNALTNLSEF